MKISFLCFQCFPLFSPKNTSPFGGAEVQIFHLAEELKKNHQIRIIVSPVDTTNINHDASEQTGIFLSFFSRKVPSLFDIKYIRAFFLFFRFFRFLYQEQSDLYVQRTAGFETYIMVLFCRIFRKKNIYMVAHDDEVNGNWEKGLGVFSHKGYIERQCFLLAIRKAQKVIVQNEIQQKNLLEKYNIHSQLIRSGYPLQKKQKTSSDKNHILWVARGEPWKKPERFFELASHFPSESFFMICPKGNDVSYWEHLKNTAKKYSNINWIGGVSFFEIESYFRTAKLFVHTADSEGFPNTFLQSMIAKTPILSYAVNPDGLFEKYKCGICVEESKSKFIQQCSKILKNTTFSNTLSQNGEAYVQKFHDIKQIAPLILSETKNISKKFAKKKYT